MKSLAVVEMHTAGYRVEDKDGLYLCTSMQAFTQGTGVEQMELHTVVIG